MTQDARVTAIRNDALIGRGTCSVVDECMTDAEIVAALDEDGITTPQAAVEWALDVEGIEYEKGLNQRWGEDDDPQLLAYNEWKEKIRERMGE